MKNTKDVKEILDIPNIEIWLNEVFTLSCYDAGDKLLIYSLEKGGRVCDVQISLDKHPRLIEGQKKLSDLIIIEDIGMFELDYGVQTKEWDDEIGTWFYRWFEVIQSHWYRPFLSKSEREF